MGEARDQRYPLESLRELRGVEAERAEAELVAARAELATSEAELQALEQALRAARRSGATRANSGAELARMAAHEAATRTELTAKLAAAREAHQARARALRLAELSWQSARVDNAVIDRHRERFLETEQRAAQRKADDDADDLHATRAARRARPAGDESR